MNRSVIALVLVNVCVTVALLSLAAVLVMYGPLALVLSLVASALAAVVATEVT